MDWIEGFLQRYPELAVFLAVALGYRIGGIKFAGVAFGPVTGSLFAGLVIGQFADVPIAGMAKSFLFLLFLFGIGYSVGPQFLQALRQGGIQSVLLAVVCTVTGLLAALGVSRLLGLDAGFSAGLLTGALTQSPAMGTATETIGTLGLPAAEAALLVSHVAIADAVCYIFGAAGAIWFCSIAAPKLLGLDLVAEAKALEADLGISATAAGVASSYSPFALRAYVAAPGAAIVGETIAEAEKRNIAYRLFVLRLRRGDKILEARPDLVVEPGDVLAIGGRREAIVQLIGAHADEVDDAELLDAPFLAVEILLMRPEMVGVTLQAASELDWTRGVYLRSITRGGQPLPMAPGLRLERGDILRVLGPEDAVNRASALLGQVIAPTVATDFVVLGLAIFLGGLVGSLLHFSIAGINVSLGTSVGALVAGLVVGHLRTRFPLFGRIPDGAVALMTALGLAAFVAMTGLHAGPVFLSALAEAGVGLLLGGVVVTLVPLLVGLAFGRWVLRMKPILLLGAIAGALTMTAAMAAVQERSNSPVAVLGYTPAYPIAQILLTLWGSIIVVLTTG